MQLGPFFILSPLRLLLFLLFDLRLMGCPTNARWTIGVSWGVAISVFYHAYKKGSSDAVDFHALF
jgi:hypothetical protein